MPSTEATVLIVDDSQANLALLEHMLAGEECSVIAASSGFQAVEMARNIDLALILLDIQMPGLSGFEVAEQIKNLERSRHVPIIFITAIHQEPEHIRRGYALGAVDYLFRPFDLAALRGKVRFFLDLHRRKVSLELEMGRQKQSTQRLQRREEKYRQIFERSVEGMFRSSLDGTILEANDAYLKIFGYQDFSQLAGIPQTTLSIMADGKERELYRDLILKEGLVDNYEFRARRNDGDIIWCSESSRVVEESGRPPVVVGVLEDITQRKRAELELRHRATMDSLTGVANRQKFFDRMEHALARARRYQAKLAVLFIDLDFFKSINDTHGHQVGDDLLRMVAQRMESRIRSSDTIARLGGDEFGLLLEEVEDREGVVIVAKGLLDALNKPFEVGDLKINMGATIGISRFPDDGDDGPILVSAADEAMYRAKRRDAEKYGFYSDPE